MTRFGRLRCTMAVPRVYDPLLAVCVANGILLGLYTAARSTEGKRSALPLA
jgi:hypothetical protein